MKFPQGKKTILHLVLISIFVWLLETVVEFLFFEDVTFWGLLLTDISSHEIYMRILIIAACLLLYLIFIKNKIIEEKEVQIENILNNVIPVCITNADHEIIMANDSYWSIFGKPPDDTKTIKCYEHRPGKDCHTEQCALTQIMDGSNKFVSDSKKTYAGTERHYIITARPFLDSNKNPTGIIECFQDITTRKQLEKEKEDLIAKLQKSLNSVKLLSGLIPICASCKKIRDDKGYWNQIEAYIRDHSEAEFSHGICPVCAKKLYPDIFQDKD